MFVDDDSFYVEVYWEDGVLLVSIIIVDDIIVIEVRVFVK